MPIQWEPFVDLIRNHRNILMTTHVRPDGDGLGSMRGLAEVLEQQGKQVKMVVASNLPPRYDFLNTDGRVKQFTLPGDDYRDAEVAMILDTGTRNQLGDFSAFLDQLNVPKVVIDHHPTQDLDIKALRLVDTNAEATGRLAFEAITALGGTLTERSASALFTAVAMDTGWFRHSNTTPATFALVAELVRAGARPEALYEMLFERSTLGRMRLRGVVLERLTTEADGKIAHTEIRRTDYAKTGAIPPDSEDMVNVTREVNGVEVGLLFMEQPAGGVKISFRSRANVDVRKIAEQFGGGGHRLASGAGLNTTLEDAKERVLKVVREALK